MSSWCCWWRSKPAADDASERAESPLTPAPTLPTPCRTPVVEQVKRPREDPAVRGVQREKKPRLQESEYTEVTTVWPSGDSLERYNKLRIDVPRPVFTGDPWQTECRARADLPHDFRDGHTLLLGDVGSSKGSKAEDDSIAEICHEYLDSRYLDSPKRS